MLDKKLFFLLCFLLLGQLSKAQEVEQQGEEKTDPDSSGVVRNALTPTSTPVLLFTTVEEEEGKKRGKRKKQKKMYFLGKKPKGA